MMTGLEPYPDARGEGTSSVTVVICTRDRPGPLGRALSSVLAAAERALAAGVSDVEIVLVDQSRERTTANEIAKVGHPLVRHLPQPDAPGLATARNAGISGAIGEVVLFTDDDCEVDPGWVLAWLDAMQTHPTAVVGFGEVLAGPRPSSLSEDSVLATFAAGAEEIAGPELFRRGPSAIGIGANLAIRAPLPASLAGFDTSFGAGAPFPAAEEFDLAYRVARDGGGILHAPGAVVTHHGWRRGAEAGVLTRGYQLGIGAMWAKHVRLADRAALVLLYRWGLGLLGKVLRQHGRRPTGIGDLLAYLRGIHRALRSHVDPGTRCIGVPSPSLDSFMMRPDGS